MPWCDDVLKSLARLELTRLLRGVDARLGVALLLAAGLVAMVHGRSVIVRQQAAISDSPRIEREEQRQILGPVGPSANAGDQLYYLFFHTVREPSPWAPLAIGQRDVQPFNLKIRLHALQGQLYDADLGNPLLASLGHFDLAFVFVVLSPLLLIGLTYNLRSAEEEGGTWPLLRSQPTRLWPVLVLRYALRAGLVTVPMWLLLGMATAWLGLPLDSRWWTVALAIPLYVAVWGAASAGVAALRRSSDFNVLALLGVWVAWTALGPALVTVAATTRAPLPEALELTVLQRQGYHGAWDEPLPEVMDAFYQRYPEWRSAAVPTDRYSNAWYYAMQQRGDDMAAGAAARYRAGLEAREAWVSRAMLLFPPAVFHRTLSRVARTDLRAHLAYLDSVAAYHERLKRHFLPVIFGNHTVGAVRWDAVPTHRHRD